MFHIPACPLHQHSGEHFVSGCTGVESPGYAVITTPKDSVDDRPPETQVTEVPLASAAAMLA